MSARLIYPNAESPLVSKRFLPVNNGVNKRGTKTSVNFLRYDSREVEFHLNDKRTLRERGKEGWNMRTGQSLRKRTLIQGREEIPARPTTVNNRFRVPLRVILDPVAPGNHFSFPMNSIPDIPGSCAATVGTVERTKLPRNGSSIIKRSIVREKKKTNG